ncbi:MAG: ribonuclease P Rpr2/Rpp21/SNM1 subunit [Desulfurococcaceae archaeon]
MSTRVYILKDLARQRIAILFNLARSRARLGDYELARRYIEIALKISKKAKVKLKRSYKRSYCRSCFAPLIPGITLSVRIRSEGKGSRVVYRCLLCGWTRRYMIKNRTRKSKQE